MNLASALIKRILEECDFDTWASLRKHYLPKEYHAIFTLIDKHVEQYQVLPSIDDLKLSIRDEKTLEKLFIIESSEVDSEPFLLLDYIKNEFAQNEALTQIYKYVDDSIAFETAEETVESLYKIIANIEDKVELNSSIDNMQKLSLFVPTEEVNSYIKLGLNAEFDNRVRFKTTDYIMLGGRRGAGKSLVSANIGSNCVSQGKSCIYFTIEMQSREILQRHTSISTGIPHHKLKYRDLDNLEWQRLANWWAGRFEGGEEHLEFYKDSRDFDKFHALVSKLPLKEAQFDIVYDPNLTLSKIRAESVKRVKKLGNVSAVIVDYINQVKRFGNGVDDLYDWKEQINVSKGLKALSQELGVPFISPYQIDALGEARFAKGILDSADAAFVLNPGVDYIEFDCSKMRDDAEINFISAVDWSCLKIGPQNGVKPEAQKNNTKSKNFNKSNIYDD